MPNNIIKLVNLPDDYLKNRVKNMPDINVVNSHYNEEGMNRRLALYKSLNESQKGDPSVSEFFSQKNVELLNIDGKLNITESLERIKIFLDRVYFFYFIVKIERKCK